MTNSSDKDITHNISIIPLVESSGVTLLREGKHWVGNCPFHEDTGQSLLVDAESNHWQCDGDCQTGGSAVEWVMKAKHVSQTHAIEMLRHDHPISVTSDTKVKHSTVRELDVPFTKEDDDQTVFHHVLDYYNQTLKQSPDALAYLKSRCIDNVDAIEKFKLGFSNRTLGYHMPAKNRREGALMRGRLQRFGIIRSNGHEHFRGSIVVPIINHGIVHQVYGRKITNKLRSGTPIHCTLPGPVSGIFNLEAVQVSDELILCQSVIDALTFWCAGFRNVTCTFGTNVDIAEHVSAFEQCGTQRVLIAYAATSESDTATDKVAAQLTEVGIDAYRIEMPRSFDVNEYAVNTDSPNDSLGQLIRKAVWMGNGKPPSPHSHAVAVDGDNVITASCEDADGTSSDVEIGVEDDEAGLHASVIPEPACDVDAQVRDNEVVICLEDRRYRIRGLDKNLSYDTLKLNILVSCDEAIHVDTFDLYSSKHRGAFIRLASGEIGIGEDVIKNDLSKVLLKLEVLQHENIQETLTPKQKEIVLTKKERDEAMALLKSPNLMQRIPGDYARCGIVGEKTNILVSYLAATSRKLQLPLAIIIQSTSAAGKSALMDAVLSFVPEEDCLQYSAMTGQSLFYMDINMENKILAINEEEGASKATYQLKLLQSDGKLTIASTGKDQNSGRHVTHEYQVKGPVMIFSTTSSINVDDELLNRCLVLTVDEDREQTKAIHDNQRFMETLDGLMASQTRNELIQLHRNAQRLLMPYMVVNPYAELLTFSNVRTRTRRDHMKYLTLIRTIALLHQHQREVKTTYLNGKPRQYIEVTFDDIELANQLSNEVLGLSLDDVPPQTRKLLMLIDDMVSAQCITSDCSRSDVHFGRRQIREYTGWGETQLKVHLQRLVAMEYLLIRRGGRGRQIVYELLYNSEGLDGQPFLMGLIDIDTLRNENNGEHTTRANELLSGLPRAPVGLLSGSSQSTNNASTHCNNR